MTLTDQHVSLTAKKAALERAAAVAQENWRGLACPAYMAQSGQAACKRCGTSIMQSHQRLPAYTEITLTFTDGSAHITNLCRSCAAGGMNLPLLDAMYCADMLVLADEEDREGVLMRWELMANRQVSGFRM